MLYSKVLEGYTKVDVNLPRRTVLIQDAIVQENQREIISYEDLNVMLQDKSYCLCEWIKIKKNEAVPMVNLHMVGVKVV